MIFLKLHLTHFLLAETPSKMMKNDFYFMLKALFVLKIFKFLSLIFLHIGKRFDKKAKLMAQLGKQTITIHILANISRSKGNQIMKFGRFINIR